MGRSQVRRGKKAEDRIAKAFSAACGKQFARTPGSGSGHSWKFFQGERVRGDVVCLDKSECFPFLIESKKVPKDWPWDWVLTGKPLTEWRAWWDKVQEDARADGKFPMLVISRNQGPMVAFLWCDNVVQVGMNANFAHTRFSYREYGPNAVVLAADLEDIATAYAAGQIRSHNRKGLTTHGT